MSEADAFRDAAALLDALAARDRVGGRVILDNCNAREVAKALAATIIAVDSILPGLASGIASQMRVFDPERHP